MGPEKVDTKSLSASELRKVNKPLMEKKRRARINDSLNELKTLVLDALKRDTSRYSKLEKADILEMTVKHLRTVQRQQMAAAMVQDSSVVGKYQSGFSECASEVSRYLSTIDGLPSEVRCRLLDHLSTCVHKVSGAANAYQQYPTAVTYPTATPLAAMPGSIGEVPLGGAFQLMPTTLPNGQIVLIPQNIGATTPLYVQAQEGDRRQSISSPEARDRYGSVSSPGSDDSRSVSLSSSPESDRWGSPPLREQPRGHSPVNMPSTQPPRSYCHSSLSVDHNMNLPNPVKRESSHRSDLPHCEVKPSPVLRQRSENIHIIPKDLSGHKHAEQGPVKHHVIKQEPVNTAPRPEVRYHQVPVVCEENMWRPW